MAIPNQPHSDFIAHSSETDDSSAMPMPDPWDAQKVRDSIRQLMDARGLKAHSWAESAGLSSGTLRNFLNGESQTLTLTACVKLAAAAGVTVSELIGEESPSPHRQMPPEALEPELLVAAVRALEDYLASHQPVYEMDPEPKGRAILALYLIGKRKEGASARERVTIDAEAENVIQLAARRKP